MAADHAHDQSEQQEPAKGQKHALSLDPPKHQELDGISAGQQAI